MARNAGWQDNRLAFSHFTVARLVQSFDREAAFAHLTRAYRIYRANPDTAPHAAHVAAQLAAHAIHMGDGDMALALLDGQDAVARQAENAALMASIQMLRAEALELTGQAQAAGTVRLDSLGWARYGFGPDWAVRAKLNEISSLRPASVAASTYSTPCPAAHSRFGNGSKASSFMPKPPKIRATMRPILPVPTMPAVLPCRSKPTRPLSEKFSSRTRLKAR